MDALNYQKSAQAEAECKADGWVQFDGDAELQRRRNATWQMMHLSCSSSSPTNLINSSSAPTVTSAIPSTVGTMEIKPQDFINIFLEPYNPPQNLDHSAAHGGAEEAQTLQLFPLQSSGGRRPNNVNCTHEEEQEEEEEESGAAMNTAGHVAPYQFFEFLPLKN